MWQVLANGIYLEAIGKGADSKCHRLLAPHLIPSGNLNPISSICFPCVLNKLFNSSEFLGLLGIIHKIVLPGAKVVANQQWMLLIVAPDQ